MTRLILKLLAFAIVLFVVFIFVTVHPIPEKVTYGVSFSAPHAEHLGLDWKEVYRGVLDDLGVRALRIPAYWPETEPSAGRFEWADLDFQLNGARARNAHVVLAIGQRLPRWPECHIPDWVRTLSSDERKKELREYIAAVVGRYKENPAIQYWQVENEPYLEIFGECPPLEEVFLKEEIALVHSLDNRPVLVTDSGNLGRWVGPYKNGDAFGTSLYMYFWNPEFGQFKTKLPAFVYRAKERLMEIIFGTKPTLLIELSLEPWLVEPTPETSLETQLSRMDIEKFHEIIRYAEQTSFDTQYLWGVEWWYYMKEKQGHPEFWAAAKELYSASAK